MTHALGVGLHLHPVLDGPEHAGTSTREPSTSTMQTRQALTGVRLPA